MDPVNTGEIFQTELEQLPEFGRQVIRVSVFRRNPDQLLWAEYVDDLNLIDALAICDAALYAYGTTGLQGLDAFWESQYPRHPSGERYRSR